MGSLYNEKSSAIKNIIKRAAYYMAEVNNKYNPQCVLCVNNRMKTCACARRNDALFVKAFSKPYLKIAYCFLATGR